MRAEDLTITVGGSMLAAQLAALALFVAVFTVAAVRNLNLGIAMLPVACGVGLWLADMPLAAVLAEFPVGLVVLLAGVTYFFGIAHANGTIDALIGGVVTRVGDRAVLLPLAFFALTAVVSAMGSPLAGLVTAPIGMPLAKRLHIDPLLMALAIATGLSTGAFAPTSLFGIVTYGVAQQAGIELSPFTLFAVAAVVNAALFLAAFLAFGGLALNGARHSVASRAPQSALSGCQRLTLACMLALVLVVIATAALGLDPDIGVLSFAFGAVLMLVDPSGGRAAIARIDWSTVLLVAGIITFVGVLENMGAVQLLGDAAAWLSLPMLTAFAICLIGALVSAFASTTGILAALVPLALPLVVGGEIAGWALICALGVCASLVDVSPFSTVGATLTATASEDERPRVAGWLLRWGMSLVLLGPAALVALLVWPASF
jgi:Na+/H+ antiporter NhaD/arsenite permease-like protein